MVKITSNLRAVTVDLSAVRHAPAMTHLIVVSHQPELQVVDLGPLAGHPALHSVHVSCAGLRTLDLSPLAQVPTLSRFFVGFPIGDLDVTPLIAHPTLHDLAVTSARFFIDPSVDIATVVCPAVRRLACDGQLTPRGCR